MKAFEVLLGYQFRPQEGIVDKIKSLKNYSGEIESGEEPGTLSIFETSKQKTWLVATKKRLYCILDDARKPEPHINWSMARELIVENDQVLLQIKAHDIEGNTGRVDIGDSHRNWLFSPDLFQETSVEDRVRKLIAGKMIDQANISAAE